VLQSKKHGFFQRRRTTNVIYVLGEKDRIEELKICIKQNFEIAFLRLEGVLG